MNSITIYVVTAFGASIDTEVHITYSEEEAQNLAKELIAHFKMNNDSLAEMCYNCWKGFSSTTGCDVEIEIHEKVVDLQSSSVVYHTIDNPRKDN